MIYVRIFWHATCCMTAHPRTLLLAIITYQFPFISNIDCIVILIGVHWQKHATAIVHNDKDTCFPFKYRSSYVWIGSCNWGFLGCIIKKDTILEEMDSSIQLNFFILLNAWMHSRSHWARWNRHAYGSLVYSIRVLCVVFVYKSNHNQIRMVDNNNHSLVKTEYVGGFEDTIDLMLLRVDFK